MSNLHNFSSTVITLCEETLFECKYEELWLFSLKYGNRR